MRLTAYTPRLLAPRNPVGGSSMTDSVAYTAQKLLPSSTGTQVRDSLDRVRADAQQLIQQESLLDHLKSTWNHLTDWWPFHHQAQAPWTVDLPPVASPAPQPQPKPQPKPAPKPQPKPHPKPQPKPAPKPQPKPPSGDKLKSMSASELAHLGATNHKAFLEALRPAAEAAERQYGVPAAVTLAQAALETGWGQHIIPGYNLFGMKGTGPAGSTRQLTWEVYGGKVVHIYANFQKFHNFYEGVEAHGKLFHNGYYNKALDNFKRYHSAERFARDITGVYATDPSYGAKLISIMRTYHLE